MIRVGIVFLAFAAVFLSVSFVAASIYAMGSLFREWLRDKLNPGARDAAMCAHPAGGRFEVAAWHSDGRLKSVGGMEPGAWLAQAPRVRR